MLSLFVYVTRQLLNVSLTCKAKGNVSLFSCRSFKGPVPICRYEPVLSPAVSIQKEALVEESILFPDVTIGPGAKVRRAIIEKGLHIPAGFEIGYDLERDSKMFHVTPSGIVVLAKDTIIKA